MYRKQAGILSVVENDFQLISNLIGLQEVVDNSSITAQIRCEQLTKLTNQYILPT